MAAGIYGASLKTGECSRTMLFREAGGTGLAAALDIKALRQFAHKLFDLPRIVFKSCLVRRLRLVCGERLVEAQVRRGKIPP